MSRYNVFQAIIMSFYSRNLYRDVAINWGGKAFLYLLFILALSWVSGTYLAQAALSNGYHRFSEKITTQFPVMTITEGKLSTPENRPYIITDPDTQKPVVIIDASGKYTTLEQAKTDILVTQTSVISQSSPNEIRTTEIPKSVNLVIEPEKVDGFLKSYIGYTWIVLFIFFLLFSYLYRIVQSVIYAIIGKLFSAVTGANLSYGQVLSVTMVALTPVIVLATIFEFYNVHFAHEALFFFLLAMVYLFFGVFANRNKGDQI